MAKREDFDSGLLAMAEREERILSQELHDTICQSLLGISLLVQSAIKAKTAGKDIRASDLEDIRIHLDSAIEQSRIFMDSQLLSAHPEKLPEALMRLTKVINNQVPCCCDADPALKISDADMAKMTYRIARDCLLRIVKEAQPGQMEVRLREKDRALILEITHDGLHHHPGTNKCILNEGGLWKRIFHHVGFRWKTEVLSNGVRLSCAAPS